MSKVSANTERIKNEVAPYNPTIIAVTKYFDENMIIEYYNIGFRNFGENRVKEALEKIEKLPEYIRSDSKFHLIGHLQSNKAKYAVGNFDLIHSVDSLRLASVIDEEARKKNIVQKILLQINNANENQKYGFSVEELRKVFPEIIKLKSIKVCGVMNIAPLHCDEKKLHELFENIKQINDELQSESGLELNEISMGMSNDYKIALEEGATMIRLGRILFE